MSKKRLTKKAKVAIGVLAVAIAGGCGAAVYLNRDTGTDALLLKGEEIDGTQTISFEYGEDVILKPETFLSDEVSKKVINEAELDAPFSEDTEDYIVDDETKKVVSATDNYLEPGQYSMSITWDGTTKDFILSVNDTSAPVFFDYSDEITVLTNAEVNLVDYFYATDLSGDVTISILKSDADVSTLDTSSYDQSAEVSKEILSTAGDYEINVFATDKHGLQAEETCTVHVVEDGDTSTLTTPRGWIALNDGFFNGSDQEVDEEGRAQMPSGTWVKLGMLTYPTRAGEEVVESEDPISSEAPEGFEELTDEEKEAVLQEQIEYYESQGYEVENKENEILDDAE